MQRTVQLKQDVERLGEKLKRLLELYMAYTEYDGVDVNLRRERLDEIARYATHKHVVHGII